MANSRVLSSSDEDVYHVEVITSARVNEDAEWEYLVSWAGYSADEDSWEPEENVEQCDRLLRSFWKHVGMDNEDYSPGDQFDAQPWWIKREREYFANVWRDNAKKKKKPSKDRHYAFTISGSGSKKATKDQKKTLEEFVQRQNGSQSDGATDDSDEIPLSKSLASKSKEGLLPAQRRKGRKVQKGSDTQEETRTDDEMPQKGKRPVGAPGSSKVMSARPSRPIPGNKRRRLSSPDSPHAAFSSEPPRKVARTSFPQDSSFLVVPATPTRGDTSNTRDSPSSLFSAPSSPAPIPSQRAALGPPPMSGPSRANATQSPSRPPPPKPTGPRPKVIRKPTWLLEPKIKRFDAPNLKPSSTLPTKAGLFERTADRSQPSTSRRDSTQTLPETSARRSSFMRDASNVDAQQRSSVSLSSDAQSPSVPDMPRLPPASMGETVAFLKNIMPSEMSEPMIDGVETNRPLSAPVRKQSTADLLKNTPIPRKFKWSGELRINTKNDHKERVCNVTLSETSEGSPERLRFSICFNASISFLLLEKLFTLEDLQCLQPALTPVAETARLGPENESEAQGLSTLFYYMSSRKLVSCSTINLDDNQVALLLVFPATNLILCKEYNVRPELRKAGLFIAALLPWKVVGIKARKQCLFRDPRDRTHRIFRWAQRESIVAEREDSLRKVPSYHRALSILGFPRWLDEDMSKPGLAYCIWNKNGDGTPDEPGFETRALRYILHERRAKDVGHKADVSVVFVHVGAIKTLSSLPALMERRMKRLDIRFVTYGTHHTIPPARWGMRMIYPAGGIATISPSAFAECPSTAYRLLDMLEQHPLWDCFVTPGVVALAARQKRGTDPITEFEKGTLVHQDLLSRIAQGQLTLLSMEPPAHGSKEGPLLEWIRRHQEASMLEPRGILEDCLRSFSKGYSDYPEEKWSFRVLDELNSILSSLQMQPCIMDEYRRFVVIVGKQDKIAGDWSGFEWTPIDAFNFRDDYFSKDKLEDLRSWASVEQALSALRYPDPT